MVALDHYTCTPEHVGMQLGRTIDTLASTRQRATVFGRALLIAVSGVVPMAHEPYHPRLSEREYERIGRALEWLELNTE